MPDFRNPAAFLLLLLMPALYWMRRIGLFTRISFPLILNDWNGRNFVWNSPFRRTAAIVSRILCTAAFVCVVGAFADPVIHHQEKVYTSRGTDIMFVLDTSPSMAARDIAGTTRLDAAKQAITTLVKQNGGASYALIAMSSEAAVIVPPTLDHDLFLNRLGSLVIGELGDGTAIGTGLSAAVYHLATSKAPRRCIVLVTDGENNAGAVHPVTAARLASEHGITLYVLGMGTRGSVPLEYVDPHTGKVYSGYLESGFDIQKMNELAAAGGGLYFNVESMGELETALASISRHQTVVQSYHLKNVDEYWYDRLLCASVVLFIAAWLLRRLYLKELL